MSFKPSSTSFDEEDLNVVDDENNNDEDGKDEDEESPYRDPPENHVRLRPSCAPFLPPTVFVEYPVELNMKRDDISIVEPLRHRKLGYKSYWERICVRNAFKRAGFEKSNKNWTALWSKHQTETQLNDLDCLQKVNHFPASWCVGRKDRLSRTMNTMKRLHGKEFNYHPETFVLPADKDCLIRQLHVDEKTGGRPGGNENQLWIVKPCASSCGRGISVVSGQQVKQLAGKNKKLLVQRYLSDPYLIDGKKFDLRIYVLVTGVDPLRVYVHKEGLTRISTSDYSLKNISNRFAHLTNYSVNKKAINFKAAHYVPDSASSDPNDIDQTIDDSTSKGRSSPANEDPETEGFKWSLAAFKNWLSKREGKEKTDETFDKIYDLCVKTMIAAESEITPNLHRIVSFRTNCFELFGLDVILDSALNPHLLEVNVSPSLMGSSPLDRKIKGMLIADILHVVGMYPYDANLMRKYSYGSSKLSDISSPRSATTAGGKVGNLTPGARVSSMDTDTLNILATSGNTYSSMTLNNPFGFINLSKLMANQDAYRKNPAASTIDLNSLNSEDKDIGGSNGSNLGLASDSCTWWQMILLIEDEMARAKTSGFNMIHPTRIKGSWYSSLFRNPRFTDHLLVRWIELGGIRGKAIQYLPNEVKAYFPNANRAKSASSRSSIEHKISRPPSAAAKVPSRPSSAAPANRQHPSRFSMKPPSAPSENVAKAVMTLKDSQGILSKSNEYENEGVTVNEVSQIPHPAPLPELKISDPSIQRAIISAENHSSPSQPNPNEEVGRFTPRANDLMKKHQHDLITMANTRSPNPLLQFIPDRIFDGLKEKRAAFSRVEQPSKASEGMNGFYSNQSKPADEGSLETTSLVNLHQSATKMIQENPRKVLRSENLNSASERLNLLNINLRKMRTDSHIAGVKDYAINDNMGKPPSGLRLLKQRSDISQSKVQHLQFKTIKTQSGSLILQIRDS